MFVLLFVWKVRQEWFNGTFDIKPGDEDIHTANERRLKVKINEWHMSSQGVDNKCP